MHKERPSSFFVWLKIRYKITFLVILLLTWSCLGWCLPFAIIHKFTHIVLFYTHTYIYLKYTFTKVNAGSKTTLIHIVKLSLIKVLLICTHNIALAMHERASGMTLDKHASSLWALFSCGDRDEWASGVRRTLKVVLN